MVGQHVLRVRTSFGNVKLIISNVIIKKYVQSNLGRGPRRR